MSFKKSIRNIAYAGITLATLVAASCRPEPAYDSRNSNNIPRLTESYSSSGLKSESKSHTKPKYTLGDFKRVLGDRVIPEREGELEEFWRSEKEDITSLIQLYEGTIKPEFKDEKTRKEYEQFNPNSLSQLELNDYQRQIPWKIIPKNHKFTEVDKSIIYGLKKLNDPNTTLNLKNWRLF